MPFFRERDTQQTNCGPSQKAREALKYGVVFMGWVVSWVNVLANYSFWEEAEIHGNWACPLLVSDGRPQNCHDARWVCHLADVLPWLPRWLSGKESTCQ